MNDLRSAGARHDDLVFNLLTMYGETHCLEFKNYIEFEYKNKFDSNVDISAEELMSGAQQKFITLRDQRKWVKEDEAKKHMLALVSAIKEIAIKNKQGNHKPAAEAKPKWKDRSGDNGKIYKYAEWRKVAPKNGEKHTKEVNDVTYHWCKNHRDGLWVTHEPKDCRFGKFKGGKREQPKPTQAKKDDKQDQKIKPSNEIGKALLAAAVGQKSFLAQAYAAAMNNNNDVNSED
ncbi:MAG: hypothetical protein ACXW1N_07290 [Halobacteriota archaeon]